MWIFGIFFVGLASAQIQPEVEISSGVIQGRRIATHYIDEDTDDAIRINSFKGIPFANPPVGNLRFADPEPVDPWDGVRDASTLGTACIQSPVGWLWLTHPGWNDYGEDCLNLNVYTPEDMDQDRAYPVMIWFYGGGYESGGNCQYPGHFLAARDVILVVPNYRVGIFGFINTGDDVAPGNYGLKDQTLAMRWVQENIEQFGGDPDRVTLFGQSAGGSSSSLHLMIPESRGLFHRIIGESGTDMNFWTLNYPNSDPPDYTRQTAAAVECPTDDTTAMVACMRAIEDPWEIRNNSGVTCTPGHFCQGHAPVIDGDYIPDYPQFLRDRGDYATDVQVMSGFNSEDGSLYTVFMIPESIEGGFNRSYWQHHLRASLLFYWEPQFTPERADDIYQATDFFYTPWPTLEDEELNRAVFNDMITDAAFGYVADKQLRSQSENVDGNYLYLFGYRSLATLEGQGFWNGTEWIGVPHSGELPYVFGWSLMQEAPQVRADSRILIDIMDYNEDDIAFADFTMDLWTNFAKTGNPTPEPITTPVGNDITWTEFTDDERNILIITREDVDTSVNYRADYNAFFLEYISYLVDAPIARKESKKPSRDTRTLHSSVFQEGTRNMVESFLKQRFPGEYDDLLEEMDFSY